MTSSKPPSRGPERRWPGWVSRLRSPGQPVLFVVVGAYNTAFGFATFAVIHLLFRNLHYLAVLVTSAIVSTMNAFIAYRVLVFKVKGNVALDLVRFIFVYSLALAINFVLLPALVEVVGLGVLPGQALAFLLAAMGSYLAHKHFTFRRRPVAASPVSSLIAVGGDERHGQ